MTKYIKKRLKLLKSRTWVCSLTKNIIKTMISLIFFNPIKSNQIIIILMNGKVKIWLYRKSPWPHTYKTSTWQLLINTLVYLWLPGMLTCCNRYGFSGSSGIAFDVTSIKGLNWHRLPIVVIGCRVQISSFYFWNE